MFIDSHSLPYLIEERAQELRSRAANEAVLAVIAAERRRARLEAALAAMKQAIRVKEERAAHSWQSQRRPFGPARLRGAR